MSEQFRRIQKAIPMPTQDPKSLHSTLIAVKELAEDIAGIRGTPGSSAVTWDDLVRLGLIDQSRVPKQFG